MNRAPNRRVLGRLEKLESRQMLAAELVEFTTDSDPSTATKNAPNQRSSALSVDYHYLHHGKPIALSEMPNRMAVRWNGEPSPYLPSSVRPLRNAGPSVVVYSVTAPAVIGPNVQDMVRSFTEYDSEVPVFQNLQTKSEAVVFDEIIVALDATTNPESYFANQALIADYRRLDGTPDQFVARVHSTESTDTLSIANSLNNDANVQWAAPNFYQSWKRFAVPNDPRFGNQWHAENTGQGGGVDDADVDLPVAWDVNAGGSANIIVGIVDDGVATDHPDLFNHANPGEVADDGIDNDGNGWIDDVFGWNFVNNNNQSSYTSADPHGTSVAGVAAAIGNNGVGVAGAAYNSPVLSARIFDDGDVASDANIASALYYMGGRTADGTGTWRSADVVNNSWGGGGPSSAIESALQWGTTQGRLGDGVMYLFATGNDYGNVSQPAVLSSSIPGVVAVGATNNFAERSDYSNSGPEVDLVAPSNDLRAGYLAIDTTDIPGAQGYDPSDYTGTGANGFGGTSSATPLATGIAALALAELDNQNIDFSPAELRLWMRNNTDLFGGFYDLQSGHNDDFGYGRLNAGALLESIGKPEISVTDSTTDLIDNTSTVDFGDATIGQSSSQTLRIRNQGTSQLDLAALTSSSSEFSVLTQPSDLNLAVGESTTFEIAFHPSSAGAHSATITIPSNDADETNFEVPVIGNGLIASITGTVFDDFHGNAIKDADDYGVSDLSVFLDLDSDGQLTESNTSFNESPNLPITDNNTTSSVISVPPGTPARSVEVGVEITHSYTGDLTLSLMNPNGDTVVLANRVGGSGENYTGTFFADDATSSISSGAAPFTGRFRPAEPLSGIINGALDGNWTLDVRDDAGADTGTLLSWSLLFRDTEPIATTDPNGVYSFTGLDAGDYLVRQVVPSGWQSTTATSNNVTLQSVNDSQTGVDFGMAKHDRFYATVFDDPDSDGIIDTGDNGLVNEKIFIDTNSNGQLDGGLISNFVDQPNLAIQDVATSTATQSVTGIANATDLNLRIDLTHTFTGDLTGTLISPAGTRVTLFSNLGGGGNNYTNTIFDDDAANAISSGSPPFTGSFRPEQMLDSLLAENLNGTWSFEISDDAGGDIGTINEWELIIESEESSAVTDEFGNARIDLPIGSSDVRLIQPNNRDFTVPPDGRMNVTTTASPLFGNLFGTKDLSSTIVDRGIFYHNASGGNLSSAGDAEAARDGTKVALTEGIESSFSNYTNFNLGITGILFDIDGMPVTTTTGDLQSELQFATWNGIDAAGFVDLPGAVTPTVEFIDMGNDVTRVKVTFPDDSIKNTWLRTVISASAITGLATADVFYFGNVVADLGVGNTNTRIRVNALDTVAIRANQSIEPNSANADNPHDLNRDGRVNALDTVIVRANQEIAGIVAPITAPSNQSVQGLNIANSNQSDSNPTASLDTDSDDDSLDGASNSQSISPSVVATDEYFSSLSTGP